VDILQPHQRNIPEEKGEKRENQTGQNQQSDKNSFFRRRFQNNLSEENVKYQSSKSKSIIKKSIPNVKNQIYAKKNKIHLKFNIPLTFEL